MSLFVIGAGAAVLVLFYAIGQLEDTILKNQNLGRKMWWWPAPRKQSWENDKPTDDGITIVKTKTNLGKCPVCRTATKSTPKVCPRCKTAHHWECWNYLGGCGVYGCDSQSDTNQQTSI